MNHCFYALLCLMLEGVLSRRDVQLRFLKKENHILRSRLGRQRLVLSPEERSRLLTIGAELKHQVRGLITVVQFRTYQRWVVELQTGRRVGRVGRPRMIGKNLRQLIIRLAKGNPGWGYLRIVGELIKLRCPVGKTSVRRILREKGVLTQPRPDRSNREDFQPWSAFIKMHINTLVACDFFSKNVWTPFGRRQAYFLMFVYVGSRKVWVSPAIYHPNAEWVLQQGRNLMMWLEDAGLEATHLIRDRDKKFTTPFDELLRSTGTDIVKSPVRAPNANAFAESWIATVRRECLNHFACFSLRHADRIVQTFVSYYNEHRPHQGLGNQLIDSADLPKLSLAQRSDPAGSIGCRAELDGLLKHYYRQAA